MFTMAASRRLRSMRSATERTIIGKIEALAANPLARSSNLTALRGVDGFRLRVGDWRVLYTVNTETKTLAIAAIVPRGEAYR